MRPKAKTAVGRQHAPKCGEQHSTCEASRSAGNGCQNVEQHETDRFAESAKIYTGTCFGPRDRDTNCLGGQLSEWQPRLGFLDVNTVVESWIFFECRKSGPL